MDYQGIIEIEKKRKLKNLILWKYFNVRTVTIGSKTWQMVQSFKMLWLLDGKEIMIVLILIKSV